MNAAQRRKLAREIARLRAAGWETFEEAAYRANPQLHLSYASMLALRRAVDLGYLEDCTVGDATRGADFLRTADWSDDRLREAVDAARAADKLAGLAYWDLS